MTREEQLDWLYRLRSEIYVYMPKEWLIPMNDALDMSIKALEQESILDKIRAEIEEEKEAPPCFDDDNMFAYRTGLDDALYIIDKHIGGQE